MKNPHITYEKSIEMCGCTTVNSDVITDEAKYMILPGTMNFLEDEDIVNLCHELSSLQLHKTQKDRNKNIKFITNLVEQKFEWINVQ